MLNTPFTAFSFASAHDMLNSPTSSLGSSSTSSSTSTSTVHPEHAILAAHRRRSVDNGGLNLALNDHTGSGSGKGWGGWETDPSQSASGRINYAELVLAMREETATTIDHAHPATSATLVPSSELEAQRLDLIQKLAHWDFDASHLSQDEVLMCACLLFETLWSIEGMKEAIGLEFGERRQTLTVSHFLTTSPHRVARALFKPNLQNISLQNVISQFSTCCRRPTGDLLLPSRGRLRSQCGYPSRERG